MAEPTVKDWTADQLAEQLQVHVDTLRRWARAGQVPHYKLPGGDLRFPPEVLDFIRSGRQPAETK